MEDAMEHFFDKKKMYQSEMRAHKAKQQKLDKRSKWAARLVPLDDVKQCCKDKCINGCIPRPLLERTRKVCLSRLLGVFSKSGNSSNSLRLLQRTSCNSGIRLTGNNLSLTFSTSHRHLALLFLKDIIPFAGRD
jgi:hypothetical protein